MGVARKQPGLLEKQGQKNRHRPVADQKAESATKPESISGTVAKAHQDMQKQTTQLKTKKGQDLKKQGRKNR